MVDSEDFVAVTTFSRTLVLVYRGHCNPPPSQLQYRQETAPCQQPRRNHKKSNRHPYPSKYTPQQIQTILNQAFIGTSMNQIEVLNNLPFIVRLEDKKGRKYWSNLRLYDTGVVEVDHCKVHMIHLTEDEECPSCSYDTKDILEYSFCGNKGTKFLGTTDVLWDTEYFYSQLSIEVTILSHRCDEGSFAIDAILRNDVIIARCVRETCILCGSKVGRQETVNFLRLKGGMT
jgi:hypothetical protein